jgi:DNA-binding MarR family transcriptional regulator
MDGKKMREEYLRVSHRLGRIQMCNAPLVLGDVTHLEFFTLEVLHKFKEKDPQSKGIYVSELACNLKASPPVVSRMLRTLEGKGHITRSVDEVDRRNTYILLTEKGENMRQQAVFQLEVLFKKVFLSMGEEEMETLLMLWNRFADLLEQEFSNIQKGEKEC